MPMNLPKYEGSKVDYAAMAKTIRDIYEARGKETDEKFQNMYKALLEGGKGFGNYWAADKAAMEAKLNEAIESGDPDLIQDAYNNLAKSLKFSKDEKRSMDIKRARAMGMSPNFDGVI